MDEHVYPAEARDHAHQFAHLTGLRFRHPNIAPLVGGKAAHAVAVFQGLKRIGGEKIAIGGQP